MKKFTYLSSGLIALVVGLALFAAQTKTAYGELVFDEEINLSLENEKESSEESVTSFSSAENDTAKKEDSQSTADRAEAERLRRQRIRQEVKNEDLLTKKLEALRLKDEMKRTDQLLNASTSAEQESEDMKPKATQSASANTVIQTQVIKSEEEENETPETDMAIQSAIQKDVAEIDEEASASKSTVERIYVTPRFGLSGIVNSIYDIQSQYSAGFGLGFDLGDILAIEGGYTYSTYQIASVILLMGIQVDCNNFS